MNGDSANLTIPPDLVALDAASGPLAAALDLLRTGGPVVAILGLMSVFALTIVLLKAWQFRAVRVFDGTIARRLLALHRNGRDAEALALAARSPNPVARVVAAAIRGRNRALPEHQVREEVVRHAAELVETLRSWLRPLEVIGSLAPLLGLFGTVLGMIGAFQALEKAGNRVDPSILSGGIWEALLTTAVGLAVAMPAVAALSFFDRIVERVAHDMDQFVTQVFTEDLTVMREEKSVHERIGLRAAAAAGE
jgi:biopolymer transport protein ExbB